MSATDDRVYDQLADVIQEAVAAGWTPEALVQQAGYAWKYELERKMELDIKSFRRMLDR